MNLFFTHNRARLHKLYRSLLPEIFKVFQIDAVLGAAPHYRQNHDFGRIAKELGVPYIVIMKECLITNFKHHQRIVDFYSKIDRGTISHILVHNDVTKEAILESGLVGPQGISSIGSIRMDVYLEKLRSTSRNTVRKYKKDKHVVLFSFLQGVGLYGWTLVRPRRRDGAGYFNLFDQVHQVVGELAREFPDMLFTIKIKWGGDKWIGEIDNSLKRSGLDRTALGNIVITDNVPAQDLILSADVVIGFGSTTILEAAIANKPVIVPAFEEASRPEYQGYIQLANTYDAYDIATSRSDLRKLILQGLGGSTVSSEAMELRRLYFSRYVSDIKGGAIDRYKTKLAEIMEEGRARR